MADLQFLLKTPLLKRSRKQGLPLLYNLRRNRPFLVHINIPPTISGAQPLQSCSLSDLMTISIKNTVSTLLNIEFIKGPSDVMVRPPCKWNHTPHQSKFGSVRLKSCIEKLSATSYRGLEVADRLWRKWKCWNRGHLVAATAKKASFNTICTAL